MDETKLTGKLSPIRFATAAMDTRIGYVLNLGLWPECALSRPHVVSCLLHKRVRLL